MSLKPQRRFAIASALILISAAAWAVERSSKRPPTPPCDHAAEKAPRAFPALDLDCRRHVAYLGVYSSDGKFRAVSRLARMQNGVDPDAENKAADLPVSVDRRPKMQVVEIFEPPAHASEALTPQSTFSVIRDDLVVLAYGRERLLVSPASVTMDSRGRLIVSDPGAASIYVLNGKESLRIAGGEGRRLKSPSGIAVDGEDNIYVADSDRGVVIVYNREGNFLRYIGKIGDESLLSDPTGLTIDRKNGYLYVLDKARNLLLVFNLQGDLINRAGMGTLNSSGLLVRDRRSPERKALNSGNVVFDHPVALALKDDHLFILDSAGSRIQVLDQHLQLVSKMIIRGVRGTHEAGMGLALDSQGAMYVSGVDGDCVRVYDRNGKPFGLFGQLGNRFGEFKSLSAVWIDASGKLFVADTGNRRVQVFQLGIADAPNVTTESNR